MTGPTCVICQRPVADQAYCCGLCTDRAYRWLGDIASLAADAQDAAGGLARYSAPGRRSGGDDRAPINLTAADALRHAVNDVTTWARHIAEARGQTVPTPDRRPAHGPGCPTGSCTHRSCHAIRYRPTDHHAAVAARWIATQLGWLRHRPEAAEAYDALQQAARTITRIADRPPADVLVGVCECGSWLYARAGRPIARCNTTDCGRQWDVERSRDTLRAAMDDKLLTAAQIATVAARAGHDRNRVRKLVTTWARRGIIAPRGMLDGAATYRLGDVTDRLARTPLDLAG
ncbi:hypothetical protein [Micromonospora sp. WMMD1082]|uniref:hypothetical protein n=1 Tax=Micromonospora sp. WMMD1082 TaxID=3016104 RepID=UPI002416CE46|nr:hypothetical protein [Micromonospora sp. WMMD1082]MDG4796199.1 hypothetical protein [Micromonospora sp. WMMD1082]